MRPFEGFKYLRQGIVRFVALYLLLGLVAGCVTPIGVVRGTTQQTYYALTANVLSAGEPSSWSQQVLQRNDLFERFENDPSAALALLLEGSAAYDFELAGFRFADKHQILGDGLLMMHPYRPGRIPVVLVHGTASSPARWGI
jgi:hypothetical protein